MTVPENPRRHLILLIALLTLIIVGPLLSASRHGTLLLNVIGAAMLLSALYAISECKQIIVIAVILSILSIVGTFLLQAYPGHAMVIVTHTACHQNLSREISFAELPFDFLGKLPRNAK